MGVVYLQLSPTRSAGRKFAVALLAPVLLVGALTIISNVRLALEKDGEIGLSAFILGTVATSGGGETLVVDEWLKRLDCVDLVAQMSPSLERHGLEWGNAWRTPIFMLVGYLIDPGEYMRLKEEAMTTAKAFLLAEHTDIRARDYYSCALTDAYGNFGAVGYLLAAVYFTLATMAIMFAFNSSSGALLILGAFGFVHTMTFEAELATHLFGWIRLLPAVVLLVAINPIRRLRRVAPENLARQG